MSDKDYMEWLGGNPDEPGASPSQPFRPSPRYPVPNHLRWATTITIVGSLLCWVLVLPFGIIAMSSASEAKRNVESGDIDSAIAASDKAKTYATIATWAAVVGFVFFVVYLMSMV